MSMIKKTIYNNGLVKPHSITVECAGQKIEFRFDERQKAGEWMKKVWEGQEDGFFNIYSPAYVYYNIDWDQDHVLFAKYELIS